MQGRILIFCFLGGSILRLSARAVPFNGLLGAVCGALSLWAFSKPAIAYLAALPLAYFAVWIGMQKLPRKLPGDYSYGLYLIAYPVQQTYSLLFPDFRAWWANLLICLPVALIYAAFSWHCIEKPFLARKHAIIGFVLFRRFRPRPA